MLIILEGPPGVGKSDLAEKLSAEIIRRHPQDTVEIRRQGIPRQHPLDEYVLPLLDYRPHREGYARQTDGSLERLSARHIICDGYHWGEMVHSVIFARRSTLIDPVLHYIGMFLASRGAHIVRLTRDATDLMDAAKDRGYGTLSSPEITMMSAIAAFAGLATLLYPPSETMHVESENIVADILSRARTREAEAGELENLITYVGAPRVETLVLGNARGPGIRHDLSPAFMPYPSTCGEFLMEALTHADTETFTSRVFGVANAWDVDDVEEIIEVISPRRIVCLGDRTYTMVRKLFPLVANVGHPVKTRSFYGRAEGYGRTVGHIVREMKRSH